MTNLYFAPQVCYMYINPVAHPGFDPGAWKNIESVDG